MFHARTVAVTFSSIFPPDMSTKSLPFITQATFFTFPYSENSRWSHSREVKLKESIDNENWSKSSPPMKYMISYQYKFRHIFYSNWNSNSIITLFLIEQCPARCRGSTLPRWVTSVLEVWFLFRIQFQYYIPSCELTIRPSLD